MKKLTEYNIKLVITELIFIFILVSISILMKDNNIVSFGLMASGVNLLLFQYLQSKYFNIKIK
jgi:hypothetical protein